MRYPITFTVDADNFTHARQIARSFRSTLDGRNDNYHEVNAKLLKLRDPSDVEPDTADATA